ncbi:MAG: polysaccharide lyase family 7 protein [Colwellia sp.]
MNTKLKYSAVVIAASLSMSPMATHAASVTITNAGFESSFTGWEDTDPSAISSDEYEGSKAAKITGSGGKFEQEISVESNTNYTLTAYIQGTGEIGAIVDGDTSSTVGSNDDYEQVTVSFNSGSASSVTIFGAYGGDEGRFDSFTLESTGTEEPEIEEPIVEEPEEPVIVECSTLTDLEISSASDDGSNDGHGPENTIDEDTSDDSRWSSNGSGKAITYNLGAVASVQALAVKWFKGDSRSSYFDIDTSTNNSDWTSVLVSGQSDGGSSSYESIDVNDSNAQYVRITGYGNSSNTWNSIIETNILGCVEVETETPVEPEPETPVEPEPETPITSTDFDWTGWKVTLPVNGDTWYNDGNTSSAAEIQPAGCTGDIFDDNLSLDYFWSDSEGLHFKVPMNLDGKTPNTSYIRSELRELNDWSPCNSTSEANWSYGGNHTLEATVRIDDYDPDGTKVVVGQIHGHDISYATIKLHWEGDSKPIRVIYNSSPNSSSANNVYLGYIDSSDFWSYTIKMTDTGIELSAGGVTETITFGDELSNDWKDADFYFKAGLYPQQKPDADSAEVYEATFSKAVITH